MKTILLGLDAFDPTRFEALFERGLMPNLGKFVAANQYSRFQISNPAQSEVSWTSIATGLNPGAHGMFDFVHRSPKNYSLHVSLLPTQSGIAGTKFVPPYTAKTIFDIAADQGYPATALWWPAMFPARPESPVRTIPGLGTPDIFGRLGIGQLYATDPSLPDRIGKTPVTKLTKLSKSRFSGTMNGPSQQGKPSAKNPSLQIEINILNDQTVKLKLGEQVFELVPGKWSPIISIEFKIGWFFSVKAITRLILTHVQPDLRLYSLPLQIHPLKPLWRYGSPGEFVRSSYTKSGPFLTLGWPQDTIGLEDGCINDEQFLDLCHQVFSVRKRVFLDQIPNFSEGLLASVFDSLDRIQHMFWRDNPEVIEHWYLMLDELVGEVSSRINWEGAKPTRLLVVSDHGFNRFDYKVHLNRWLQQEGFLEAGADLSSTNLHPVQWQNTRAYAIGLNSLYLNLAGREGQGCVKVEEIPQLEQTIKEKLLAWRGPDGNQVVRSVFTRREALEGGLAALGPDFLIGYAPGYRASSETGLGGWNEAVIEANCDHWGADHCIDPTAVPGVIFSNHGLEDYPQPSYKDIPALAIDARPDSSAKPPPNSRSDEEDEKLVEERLKSLGYL